MPARTRAFLDALAEEFSSGECQRLEDEVQDAKRPRNAAADRAG
jgi:hypothetical protein